MIRQVQTDKRFFKHMETYKLIALQYMRNKPILLIGGKCQALYKEKNKTIINKLYNKCNRTII